MRYFLEMYTLESALLGLRITEALHRFRFLIAYVLWEIVGWTVLLSPLMGDLGLMDSKVCALSI